MKRTNLTRSLCLVVLLSSAATAHDFWVHAKSLRCPIDQPLALDLRVGHPLESESVVRSQQLLDRFVVIDGLGERAVVGREGHAPAGFTRSRVIGPLVVAYAGKPQPLEMEPAKFEAYLAEEGLENILAWRRENGESEAPGRERYARCAKALFEVESSSGEERTKEDRAADRVLRSQSCDLDLELFPISDEARGQKVGKTTSGFQLRYSGEPLEGVLVRALHLYRPNVGHEARTNARGRVDLELGERGPWLIKAVHMVRSTDEEDGADWNSYWASLLLELPTAESSAPPSK